MLTNDLGNIGLYSTSDPNSLSSSVSLGMPYCSGHMGRVMHTGLMFLQEYNAYTKVQ